MRQDTHTDEQTAGLAFSTPSLHPNISMMQHAVTRTRSTMPSSETEMRGVSSKRGAFFAKRQHGYPVGPVSQMHSLRWSPNSRGTRHAVRVAILFGSLCCDTTLTRETTSPASERTPARVEEAGVALDRHLANPSYEVI